MKPTVEQAIEEIRRTFAGYPIEVFEDSDGGAYVKVHDLTLGAKYTPTKSFVAFRITFQYPMADVYPHFLVHGLDHVDGKTRERPFHADNQRWGPPGKEEPATMVSRRSNQLNAETDTACGKLLKVLEWVRSQ